MFTVIIVVCLLKRMCMPSFVLIGCCVSKLHGHLCPYRNVWPEAVVVLQELHCLQKRLNFVTGVRDNGYLRSCVNPELDRFTIDISTGMSSPPWYGRGQCEFLFLSGKHVSLRLSLSLIQQPSPQQAGPLSGLLITYMYTLHHTTTQGNYTTTDSPGNRSCS